VGNDPSALVLGDNIFYGHDLVKLLNNADQAMYAAKAEGRNRSCYFTLSMQEQAQTRMRLVNDLHLALDQSQFSLDFQPIVDLASGRIAKAETLLRWHHPVRGLVSPNEFIPLAEETGIIRSIGDWVFCEADATFEMVSVRHSIKREAFRAKFDRMPEVMVAEVPDAANFALNYCRIPTVASKMFWPGAERIFTLENQLRYLNTYEKSGAEPCEEIGPEGAEIIERFMAHVANTIGSEREQRILLDFMAYVYQNPGKRVQWALLVKGIEGNGKSYFFKVMQAVLGRQASVVSTTAIDSSFTGWAEGSVLVCIEEIRISGVNKYAILDKMKPLITNPTIAVVHKGKDEKHIPNFTSYMMFTNHADAIPVGDNDRRYCVIFTRQTRKEELFEQHGGAEGLDSYFRGLFGDLDRRPDVFARMLSDWKISDDFSPAGRAPETEGLSDMRAMHISEDRDNVETAIAEYACAIIGTDIIDVTHLKNMAVMDGRDFPQTKAIGHILSDMGYTPVEGRKIKITKTRANHYVWFRRGSLRPTGELLSPNEVKNVVREFHNGEKDFGDAPF
jgi:hypothetical protein